MQILVPCKNNARSSEYAASAAQTRFADPESYLPDDLPRAGLYDTGVMEPTCEQEAMLSSRWCASGHKRVFDTLACLLILIPLAPVMLLIAMIVRWTSNGPAIFRQERIGRHGVPFTILKFRTMHTAIEGSSRSSHDDHRLTVPGRFLRKYKLDELPQLINVCRGEMSLVGPRPKLGDHNIVNFCFRPGVTGAATLAFAAEEHLLRDIPAQHLEEFHSRVICPCKLALDLEYMARATFRSDVHLLWKTLMRADRYTSLSQLGELGGWQPHPQRYAAARPERSTRGAVSPYQA